MHIHLVRHAHAGQRGPGTRDIYRPLSDQGGREADGLVALLPETGPVISSPATRCVQTVEPLARVRGVEVIEHPDLWEGTRTSDTWALLTTSAVDGLVACSHGDVIPELIDHLAASGAALHGRGCEKGSIWTIELDGDRAVSARYTPPPAG